MTDALIQLGLFTAKTMIILILIIGVLTLFIGLLAKGKEKMKGRLTIKNLSHDYQETQQQLLAETMPKKEFKTYLKNKKIEEKNRLKADEKQKSIFVIHFHGDLKASAVTALTEEITAILNIATPQDEVVLRLESPGGVVHGYGLAAAQLMRLRAKNIPLIIAIDKVAASGGYMMAAVGSKVLAAPFAIIGSIGVVVQLPNFHRLLKSKHIDYEMHTAGEFKRTLTLFGENTQEGRDKLQDEIEDIHGLFKNLIKTHRPQIDIQQVATGEYWLGEQALELKLVDEIRTCDDYLLAQSHLAQLFEINYETKKSLLAKLTGTAAQLFHENWFEFSRL